MHQCWTDGKCDFLYEVKSAGMYVGNANYQSTIINTLSRDGLKVTFTGTDGKYSQSDHDNFGVSPYGPEGLFLLELKRTGKAR